MDIKNTITSLPLSQQVALWAILRMKESNKKSFSFSSSDFSKNFRPFVKSYLSANPEEYGKFIGATLSSLMRNEVLVKLTGDRDKLWTLSDNVKANYDEFKRELFEMKTYWS